MEPMVSGRVPLALRNRVNLKLKEIGSNPTELINRAYEFVDRTGGLPSVISQLRPGKRHLLEEDKKEIESFFEKTTFPVPESFFAGRSYDEILEQELRSKYEALS